MNFLLIAQLATIAGLSGAVAGLARVLASDGTAAGTLTSRSAKRRSGFSSFGVERKVEEMRAERRSPAANVLLWDSRNALEEGGKDPYPGRLEPCSDAGGGTPRKARKSSARSVWEALYR